jgi:hypothetical protein
MRQLSPATNLILACLAALGLVGILGAPWYAPAVPDTNIYDGPVERAAFAVSHVFNHHDRVVTGTDALGSGSKTLLMALVAAVIVLSALAAVPALRTYVRDVLRAVALALPLLVFYLLVDRPRKGNLDIHWGVIAAFAVAGFIASAAWHGSSIRVKRVAPGTWERRTA